MSPDSLPTPPSQHERIAHTIAQTRDGARYALSDWSIYLAHQLAEGGGVVCACGNFSSEMSSGWMLIDDRPRCPACREKLQAVGSGV